MIRVLLFLFMLSSFSFYSSAQESRFRAGAIAGLNFAELEGDGLLDYYGLNAGLIGTAELTDFIQLGVEFLFSQNGEYILPDYPALEYGKIRLNHLEIPIHIDWLIDINPKNDFREWTISSGFAYARLLSHHVENSAKNDVTDQVIYTQQNGALLQAATTYFFTKQLGLNLKATVPIRFQGLSLTVAARLVYMLG